LCRPRKEWVSCDRRAGRVDGLGGPDGVEVRMRKEVWGFVFAGMDERRKQAINMELGTEPRMVKMTGMMSMMSMMSMASMVGGRRIDWRSEHTDTDTHE
jgi:hypothetical protein